MNVKWNWIIRENILYKSIVKLHKPLQYSELDKQLINCAAPITYLRSSDRL